MTRILLIEHSSPLRSPPNAWKVEEVKVEKFGESLIESYVSRIEDRFKSLKESLATTGNLNEDQIRRLLESFKDQFVAELREAPSQKRLRVSGPAQVENEPNGNRRSYPTALWDRVLSEDGEFMGRLRDRQVLGELEHPSEGNTKLPRVSHLVERVWRREGVVYAQHLIFRTPNGQILEELYRNNAPPGVSSRGAGSTNSVDGIDVVEASDFALDTWDFVAQPSVGFARPTTNTESVTKERSPIVLENANPDRYSVNLSGTSPRAGEYEMSQALIESTQSIGKADTALVESDRILSSPKPGMRALLTVQESLTGALLDLPSQFPEALQSRGVNVRAQLGERIGSIRRALVKLAEEDDEEPATTTPPAEGDTTNEDEIPPQFVQNAGKKKDGDEDDKETTEALRNLGLVREKFNKVGVASMVEQLVTQVVTLKRQVRGQVAEGKYRLAIDLGEELTERHNSDKLKYEQKISELSRELREASRANAAMKSILEATIYRYRQERVESVVEQLITDNPQLVKIESRLKECQSVKEIQALIENVVQPLAENAPVRPDLPPTRERPLVENRGGTRPAPKPQPAGKGKNLMEMLATG